MISSLTYWSIVVAVSILVYSFVHTAVLIGYMQLVKAGKVQPLYARWWFTLSCWPNVIILLIETGCRIRDRMLHS